MLANGYSSVFDHQLTVQTDAVRVFRGPGQCLWTYWESITIERCHPLHVAIATSAPKPVTLLYSLVIGQFRVADLYALMHPISSQCLLTRKPWPLYGCLGHQVLLSPRLSMSASFRSLYLHLSAVPVATSVALATINGAGRHVTSYDRGRPSR